MKRRSPFWLLGGGMIAAIGASLCCAGPFILLLLGISGSWISNLTGLGPFRPYFVGLVVALYLVAGWQVYRSSPVCTKDGLCANPNKQLFYRISFWFFTAAALLLVLSPYWLVFLS